MLRFLTRGLVRNSNLQVPLLNTGSILEQVPLSKFQNFAGSAEPTETAQCVLAWTCDFGVFAESQNISNFQARNEFLGQKFT